MPQDGQNDDTDGNNAVKPIPADTDDKKGSHGDGSCHSHTCASILPPWVVTAASYAQAFQTRLSKAFTEFRDDFTECCSYLRHQAINTWSKFTQLTLPEQCYSVAATAVALAASKYIMSPGSFVTVKDNPYLGMGDILSGHGQGAFCIHTSASGNKSEF